MKTISLVLQSFMVFLLIGCQPEPKPASSQNPSVKPTAAVEKPATPPDTSRCKLTLGYETWEPYQFMTLDNKAAGLDIELVGAAVHAMGCDLVTEQGSWTTLLGRLKEGSLDMLAGSSKTAAREEFAVFSAPYRQEQFELFVLKDRAASMPQTSITDYVNAGHKVGLTSEYFYGEELTSLYQQDGLKPQFFEASMGELNLARLIDGDIDAMLEDSFVARSMLRRKGLSNQIGSLGLTLGTKDVFVMFSKAKISEQQVTEFNQGLKRIRDDGSYLQIMQKYQQ